MESRITFTEGTDSFGSEFAEVCVTTDRLYAIHTSYRRGGCLYAGTVVVRNLREGGSREIDVTSRASDEPRHVAYLLGLAEKHVGAAA